MGGGLPLVGDPEAIHHGDDGPVPGGHVRASPGYVLRLPVRPNGDVSRAGVRTTGTAAGPARHARDPRRDRPRGDPQAHLLAPHASGSRRHHGVVRQLAAPVHLRRLARRVPSGARAREPDGRRHARQVPVVRSATPSVWSTTWRRVGSTISRPDARATCWRWARRATSMTTACSADCDDGFYLTSTSGGAARMDARPA